jgi:hypothetical protein
MWLIDQVQSLVWSVWILPDFWPCKHLLAWYHSTEPIHRIGRALHGSTEQVRLHCGSNGASDGDFSVQIWDGHYVVRVSRSNRATVGSTADATLVAVLRMELQTLQQNGSMKLRYKVVK